MIIIKKYEDKYRDGVRKICADTAHRRFTVKPKLRDVMCNMYVDYYIENEPDNVIIAVDEDTEYVCGYVVCSTDAEKFIERQKNYYTPMIKRKKYYLGVFNGICAGVSNKLDKKYGGGFHINVAVDRQGERLGPKLLTSMGLHLRDKGVKNMYLVTQNRKTRGYGFYTHYGFKEVKRYFLGSLALVFDLEDIDVKARKYL